MKNVSVLLLILVCAVAGCSRPAEESAIQSSEPGSVEQITGTVATPTDQPGDPAPLSGTGARIGAHGLALPATFTGTLPCADCEGIRYHLDLWPDQAYAMRREWLGKPEALIRDEVGRWYVDPARSALILYGAAEMPLQWRIKGPDTLRQLDMAGEPIESTLPYELSGGELTPTDLHLFLQGTFTYLADAAGFQECLTGQFFPVVMEGAYLALERAYLAAGLEPGAPLMASVEGRIEPREPMEGPERRQVIVDRLVNVWTDGECLSQPAPASLTNVYWRILALGDEPLTLPGWQREPFLLLGAPDAARFSATVGCNMMSGSFEADAAQLRFGPVAATRMACPPPLDAAERAFARILEATTGRTSAGPHLELRDRDGARLARLEAVYTRF
jgi:copper homeostasis protein (lipoprotein)